jgi:branched-chain amino acid transport system ATP-binding protein
VAALLELDGLSRSFGGLAAVKSVDLQVAQGEIIGLIGPNGAGKTTLFNVIAGAIRPSSGRVAFDARDVTRLPPHARCKLGIARTFQLVRPFLHLTVLDNAAVGAVYGRQPASSRTAAQVAGMMALEQVGLQQHANLLAGRLTLVDRKRLELARALATRPRLLLLDELLAGLNPAEVAQAIQLVQRIRATGITIIMVEHLVKAVFELSDRVVVMSAGQKICEGTPAAVAVDSRVIEAYLGA